MQRNQGIGLERSRVNIDTSRSTMLPIVLDLLYYMYVLYKMQCNEYPFDVFNQSSYINCSTFCMRANCAILQVYCIHTCYQNMSFSMSELAKLCVIIYELKTKNMTKSQYIV